MISRALHEALLTAIREKRLIEFTYKTVGRRIAEPHDYGVKGRGACLLAYQITGQSRSGAAHGWKMFDVNAIASCRVLDRTFPGSRMSALQRHIAWDRLFARV